MPARGAKPQHRVIAGIEVDVSGSLYRHVEEEFRVGINVKAEVGDSLQRAQVWREDIAQRKVATHGLGYVPTRLNNDQRNVNAAGVEVRNAAATDPQHITWEGIAAAGRGVINSHRMSIEYAIYVSGCCGLIVAPRGRIRCQTGHYRSDFG